MRYSFLFFLFCFHSFLGIAQLDTIYLVNEHTFLASVDRINVSNVVCKRADTLKGKEFILPRNRVRLIAYANGSLEVISVKKISSRFFTDSLFRKGMKDAEVHYRHGGGSVATGLVSFATGGILGLIPAIACSATTPKYIHLGIPKNAPVNNKYYLVGYTYKAKKMKQQKVWGGYGVGVLGAVLVGVITKV